MTENNEWDGTLREKDKRILTLKLLDSIKPEKDVINTKTWRNWNSVSLDLFLGDKHIFYSYKRDVIEKVILQLLATNATVVGSWSYYSEMNIKGFIRLINPWKLYNVWWKNVFHIDDMWFIQYSDKLIPLWSKWLYIKFLNWVAWILWFSESWEIILKKFISKDTWCFLDDSCPYITIPWSRVSQLNRWSSEFFVINEWKIDKVVLTNIQSINKTNNPIKYKIEQSISFEQFGEIQQIESDINENFVLIIWKKDNKYSLHVLKKNNWENGEAIESIPWIKEFVIMPDNTLLWVMEDWTVKKISTTFDQFEKWYIEKWWDIVMREAAVKVVTDNSNANMIDAIKSTELKEWEQWIESESTTLSEQDVILEFWSKEIPWEHKTIKELFDEAKTQEEIKRVERLVNKILVSISSFQWGLSIKNHIKDIIIKKKEEIILHDFQEEVNSVEDALNKADNFKDLINVKLLIDSLHERRKNIHWGVLAIDLWKKVQEMKKSVEKRILEYQEEGKEDILSQIQKNIEELKLYIEAISYGSDLSQIYNLDIWKQTMDLLEYLDEEEKKKQKKNLLELVSKRSSQILNEEKKESEKKELEIIRRKNEINEEIEILIWILETIHTVEAVNEIKETDTLAKKIEKEIEELPTSVKWELEIRYNKAFKDRIFFIRRESVKEKGIVQNLDDSGIDTMLYYVDTEKKDISWKLVWEPTSQWLIKLGISLDDWKRQYTWDNFFEDSDKFSDVLIWDNIEFEVTQSEFIKLNKQIEKRKNYGKNELQKLLKKLSEEKNTENGEKILEEIKNLKSQYLKARYVEKLANRLIKKEKLNPRSRVPEVDHNYIVLEEEKQSLQTLSWSLLTQKKRWGITILEWWPWLWKTVMCEHLAAVTNREIIRVQCSKKISYSEFFFAPTLKKWETSRSPAEWIKMMQKPWTIILFDEIDKLNAECMAWLHALFDSWRHVHDPQLWDFFANPDCLFLWTMNSYDPLPKAIASRATIQEIDYPSEANESYKISKYVDDDFLRELTYEEFTELWNNLDGKKEKIKNSKEHKINETLNNIKKLLKVFHLLREKYEDDYERFEYELSYRDAAQIFSMYDICHDFKKAVSDTLISKASSVVWTWDQKWQRDIVKQAIQQVFW